MKRVAITGMGLADPMGYSPDESFSNSFNDVNPVKRTTRFNLEDYPNIKCHYTAAVEPEGLDLTDVAPGDLKSLAHYIKLAVHATRQALIDSGHYGGSKHAAAIFCSGETDGPGVESFIKSLTGNKSRHSPKSIMYCFTDFLSGYITHTYQLTGHNAVISAACATGLTAIDYARRLTDEYDYVICGAGDAAVSPTHSFIFQNIGALTQEGSCPFDKKRSGLILGEAGATLILESEEKAKARGAKIYGYITGLGLASDLSTSTSPDEEGKGGQLAAERALAEAGNPVIDFINAHATSTVIGDKVEYETMRRIFPTVPMYSLKGKIGHTMSACGIVEVIHGIKSLHNGIIPSTFNLTEPLVDNDSNLLQNTRQGQFTTFIKNSYGFGGRCASIVITRG